jgi:hemerythrin
MRIIVWKDEYLTGIDEIDGQHKEFIKLINRLNIVHDMGDRKDIATRLLKELGKYAEYHFTSEENIMFLTRYPAIDRQRQAHEALLDEYSDRVQRYLNDKGTIEDIIIFLEGWFARHTVEEDRKIGGHLTDIKKDLDERSSSHGVQEPETAQTGQDDEQGRD